MLIGALQRFSLIDYPGKISCIVFTQGCNFRCPYCHNPELVEPSLFQPPFLPSLFFSFLKQRIKKIDAVVITGGEPTIQSNLLNFIREIKSLGFLIKLDTNGTNPQMLINLLDKELIDYIAMDIKAPLYLYKKAVGINIDDTLPQVIKKSINIIINSKLDYEFRTTIVDKLLNKAHILEIANLLKGAKKYILQKFIPSKALNQKYLHYSTLPEEELVYLTEELNKYNIKSDVR